MNNLLISGASSDVGKALIKSIYPHYDHIWAQYNQSIDQIVKLREETGEKILPVQADFADATSVKIMIQKITETGLLPDHFVHLAASRAKNKPYLKWKYEEYIREFEIAVGSAKEITEAFLPNMIQKGRGKIVFMLTSFVAGVPPKYQSPYIVSKYALLGLMKNLSAEFTDKGIQINAVSPDMIETKFNDGIVRKIKEMNAEKSPLGRNLHVEDVVPALTFLLSEGADAISGANLTVTAGMETR